MAFQPSYELTTLFIDELGLCGRDYSNCDPRCEGCTRTAYEGLRYAAELTLDDAMPGDDEDYGRPVTWASAEFEVQANRLMGECIAYGLPSDKAEHQHGVNAELALENLRRLFRRIEARSQEQD